MEAKRDRPAKHPLRHLPAAIALCAVFGLIGTFMGISGLSSWREPIPDLNAISLPDAPEGEEEAWAALEEVVAKIPAEYDEVLRERRPAVTALAGTNLISSVALTIGAFAAFLRRRWSVRALRTGLSLAQAYTILALGVQGWIQGELFQRTRALFQPLAEAGGLQTTMATAIVAAQIGTIALTAFWLLAQLAFYLWTAALLRRPGAAELLTTPPDGQML